MAAPPPVVGVGDNRIGTVSTRTPMGCCANTCPKDKTSASTPSSNSTTLQNCSMPDPEGPSDGKRQRNSSSQNEHSTSSNTGQIQSTALHLELESTPLRLIVGSASRSEEH